MSKRRTASEIRAYCEAATEGEWLTGEGKLWPLVLEWDMDTAEDSSRYMYPNLFDVGFWGEIEAASNAQFCVNARTDLPRALEVGVKLREALLDAIATADEKAYDLGDQIQKRHETLLAATAWLSREEADGSS